MARTWLLTALLLAPPASPAADVEPPVVGRPKEPPFSGAVGPRKFDVTLLAEPTELQAGDTVRLTVRVTTAAPWQAAPRRPDLRYHPDFKRQFHIEDDAGADRYRPETRSWEFHYRLRPLSAGVKAVPSLPLLYFKPGLLPPESGYQTARAKSVPLVVRPRDEVDVQPASSAVRAPASFYQPAGVEDVLHRTRPFALPGAALLSAILLGPPIVCGGGYLVWRSFYPDAARRARQRRSRAGQKALKALDTLGANDELVAREAAAVVGSYLASRFDLATDAPTPAEAAACLENAGSMPERVVQASAFVRACDAARFGPSGPSAAELIAAARALVLALEAEPWPSSP